MSKVQKGMWGPGDWRAHDDPSVLNPGLGTRSGCTLCLFFRKVYKPQWLLYLRLCKIHWGDLLGTQVPRPHPEFLTREVWPGIQPNHTYKKVLWQLPCRPCTDTISSVEIVERVTVTSSQTEACFFRHHTANFLCFSLSSVQVSVRVAEQQGRLGLTVSSDAYVLSDIGQVVVPLEPWVPSTQNGHRQES